MQKQLLVDPRTASQIMAVSKRKLWGMTFEETPGLPYVRCGRLVRYCPDDLQQWIDDRKTGGTAASSLDNIAASQQQWIDDRKTGGNA